MVLSARRYLKRLPRVLFTVRWRVAFAEAGQVARDLLVLGEAVRGVREQQGISVAALAVSTGVDEERIVALEDGRLDPDYELLITLAEGIGVRVSAFVLRAEDLPMRLQVNKVRSELDRCVERAVVLQVLRDDHESRWLRAELESRLAEIDGDVLDEAMAGLAAGGVLCMENDVVWASDTARCLDDLGLIGV